MVRRKRIALKLTSVAVACLISAGFLLQEGSFGSDSSASASSSLLTKYDGRLTANQEDYFDESVVYKLPETVTSDQDVSVIVSMNVDTVLDTYQKTDGKLTVAEYKNSKAGVSVVRTIDNERARLMRALTDAGVSFEVGETYDTLLSGFEITVKANDFDAVQGLLGGQATVIAGDEYEIEKTEIVENDVNVYETGIFNSTGSDYQGNGVVIAVLDTGLDYTHTAFSVDNFATPDSDLAFTLGDGSSKDVALKVGGTAAAGLTAGLTGEDVYVSKKVPYAYDYADKDPDVLPINSEHGTHVAGIIAGKDSVITGAAPNAQLAIMKVFSDTSEGAKTSWILNALEDCVVLGVDVINMSLGSSCGFSREVDKENINKLYDSVKEAGISLIAAASNSYNSTFSSEKNGNLGLTSNPDSGTVGSPATYDAALSVASISGVKTPYIKFGNDIIYFKEANDKASKAKNFVNEILASDETGRTFEYVTIPGLGTAVDYIGVDMAGKIALVKRGTTTFEDKVNAATQAGAAGIIIYNNVSGEISMSIGSALAPACSISQDDGEMLVKAAEENGGIGKITISRDQVAGPFMSDFSSWGPTSNLKIKPEITAHGGDILSAVPGQGYDRLSGTSMAAPNQAGVTSLIRQYVKEHVVADASNTTQVTALVNQIMMSTTDIAYNKNGLPYAVRKQGSGLANLTKATTTPAYISTFEGNSVMDKAKLELGDDKNKSGVYEMTFAINNISSRSLTYNVDAIVMTEGVSNTFTSHGETTVTEDGYLLSGAERKVVAVEGNGSADGNVVTVAANGVLKVTLTVTLSESDKQYLNDSFANGMYVEGFVTLTAQNGNNINLNVPYLAFYGDWTQAPIFDEEFYDTNPDELDKGIDVGDKVMADAYATRVIGGLYSDYIVTLGSYYFNQDPSSTQIAASKEHIAISNQNNGEDGNTTVNSVRSINAGLLRNVKRVDIKVVNDATGRVEYAITKYNQRKASSSGGNIYPSSIDVDFSAIERNLKNNTKYTVTLTTYIDYGDIEKNLNGEITDQNNLRNTFEFPLYVDFEAPLVTDVAYRTVYDKINKTTKLYADLSVYDNHYAMAVQVGQVYRVEGETRPLLRSFGKYMTPIYSSYNSTSVVTVELTDYINDLKNSFNYTIDSQGEFVPNDNANSFVAIVYDYAMNSAIYDIKLPSDVVSMFFDVSADAKKDLLNKNQINAGNIGEDDQVLVLSPNETFNLSDILQVYPSASWISTLDYSTSNEAVIGVVNGTVVARSSGNATITVTGKNSAGDDISAQLDVVVLTSADSALGYVKYSPIAANKFELTGYTTDFAFPVNSAEDRTIGYTDSKRTFGSDDYDQNNTPLISMYPGERVTLDYVLDAYFPDSTSVVFDSSRPAVAAVDGNGMITALYSANRDTTSTITVSLLLDGKENISLSVRVTVKNPFITNSIYLQYYRGGGDAENCVVIPDNLGITTIYSYAFSGYEWVEKDIENGDVIDEEDPYYIKQAFIGNDMIKKVVIPEGVTEIQSYAFANLTSLEEVQLPSTLKKIGLGAFYGCTSLKTVNFENVQFINKEAFYQTAIETANFASLVSFGDYAFRESKISSLNLPESCQSIGIGAFYDCANLASVVFRAPKVKVGSYAFSGCSLLASVDINAAVISPYAFFNCINLTKVALGKDVAVIGEYAFAGTKVASFNVNSANTTISTRGGNQALLYKGDQLLLVAPAYAATTISTDATSIAAGAASGNSNLTTVVANNVTTVGDYAFADCSSLKTVTMNSLNSVGNYAFAGTALTAIPNSANLTAFGSYSFAGTKIVVLTIADNAEVGDYAFLQCASMRKLTLGENVVLGEGAFFRTSLAEVTAGDGLITRFGAFAGIKTLTNVTLGERAQIGEFTFNGASALSEIDLSKAVSIGQYAFRGATSLVSVDLTNLASLGESAFNGATSLTTVTFGDKLKNIPVGAFFGCSALTSVQLGDSITVLGSYAFANSGLTSINLENVKTIGAGALGNTKLTQITLWEGEEVNGTFIGVTVGDEAFYGVKTLTEVGNIDKISLIGDYAFYGAGITSADLSSAKSIGDYAFADTAITEVSFGVEVDENGTVTKSGNLISLGENPFFGCAVKTYGVLVDVVFNGQTIGNKLIETFAVTDSVQLISGALYQKVPYGLELVSYPMAREADDYAIEEGTVRVGACAFAGSALRNVTIASTVAALGDKAFYGCENLKMVVFLSYDAPVLEEEYDESYAKDISTPYEGLGISKYFMWNTSSHKENYYYGANFVNYVGRVADKLTMVKPVNGRNYDSFIFSQYFGTVVEGSTAADSTTLKAIAAIAAIPSTIVLTEECEALVNAARAAYDLVATYDQRALVTNVNTLTAAERRLEYLKLQNQPKPPEPEPVAEFDPVPVLIGVSIGVGVLLIGAVAVIVVLLMKRKNSAD